MRSGSLFTGTGALDMAAGDVFGAEPAWFADLDPAAAALLAHHHPDVPNLRDITAVDWELVSLLSPIDLLTAGWPCQPFSLAGKRKGAEDERALWPEVDRCIRALRPRYVLLENVPAVVGAELGRVADTLASVGYRFAWVCVPASAVGAPHKRERFFLLAVADTEDERYQWPRPARVRRAGSAHGGLTAAYTGRDARQEDHPHQPAAARCSGSAPDAHGGGLGAVEHDDAAGESDAAWGSSTAADPNGRGLEGDSERDVWAHERELEAPQRDDADGRLLDWAGYEPAIRRWASVIGRPAPTPTVLGARGSRVLNPALPEWMMGLPTGWITAVPGLTRSQQLKLAGNGVVPHQAVAAYRYLLDVLEQDARAAA